MTVQRILSERALRDENSLEVAGVERRLKTVTGQLQGSGWRGHWSMNQGMTKNWGASTRGKEIPRGPL